MKSDILKFGSSFLQDFHTRSVEENWNIIKSKLISLTEKYIPSKMKPTRYNLSWFNTSLKRLNRMVQRLYNVQKKSKTVSDRTKYRDTRKIYRKQLNKTYYDYINNLIETPSSDQPKNFWRFVKSKRQDNIGVSTLEEDNSNVSDNYGKANVLNEYFHSISTEEKLELTLLGVQKLLESLNVDKAGGPDGVPTYILRELSHALAPILASLFQQKQVDAFISDFSKAFDRVPHQRLLHKLRHYGIQGSLLSWIQVILAKKTQRVALEGVLSNQCFVTSGVHQGTVLGPSLFLIYINDLPFCISSTRLFADDCFQYRSINSPVDCQNIQNDLYALIK